MGKNCPYCFAAVADDKKVCPSCGKAVDITVPFHHLRPGTVLRNRYYIGASLGQGGFGITYVGYDVLLRRKVAIKEYFPNGFVNRSNSVSSTIISNTAPADRLLFEKGKQRFHSEAYTLARFAGVDGVVDVLDYFPENNTVYIVMEFLEGVTLKEFLRRSGKLSSRETFDLFMPVINALKQIHREQLIHRDISPDNIMLLREGGRLQVKLIDFGAAKNLSSGSQKSLTVMLKPGFAPIEQYGSNDDQGVWTDVYALCATIYKCITGVTPPPAPNRISNDPLKKPSALGADIDARTEAVLLKGMCVLPSERYRNIDALLSDLLAARSGQRQPVPDPRGANQANRRQPVSYSQITMDAKQPQAAPDPRIAGQEVPYPRITMHMVPYPRVAMQTEIPETTEDLQNDKQEKATQPTPEPRNVKEMKAPQPTPERRNADQAEEPQSTTGSRVTVQMESPQTTEDLRNDKPTKAPQLTPEPREAEPEKTPEPTLEARKDKPAKEPQPTPEPRKAEPEKVPQPTSEPQKDKTEKASQLTPEPQKDKEEKASQPTQEPQKDKAEKASQPTQEPQKDKTEKASQPTQEPQKDKTEKASQPTPEPQKDKTEKASQPTPEPRKAEPAKSPQPTPEPRKSEPTKSPQPTPESRKAEPAKAPQPTPEPRKAEPVKSPQPTPESRKNKPEKTPESRKTEPVKVPQPTPEPRKAEPVKSPQPTPESRKNKPEKTPESRKTEPVKSSQPASKSSKDKPKKASQTTPEPREVKLTETLQPTQDARNAERTETSELTQDARNVTPPEITQWMPGFRNTVITEGIQSEEQMQEKQPGGISSKGKKILAVCAVFAVLLVISVFVIPTLLHQGESVTGEPSSSKDPDTVQSTADSDQTDQQSDPAAAFLSEAFIDPINSWSVYDDLITQIRSETDTGKRAEMMHQAEDILMSNYCVIPLFDCNDIYLQKDYVKGVYTNLFAVKFFMYATLNNGSDTLHLNINDKLDRIDPAFVNNEKDITLASNSFSGLYAYDKNGKTVPACAESYDVSSDGLTYTVKLKKGLKWSDDTALTAADFEYAWKRAADLASNAGNEYLFSDFAVFDDGKIQVTAMDDTTLQFVLTCPCVYIEDLMAFPTFYPVKKEAVEAAAGYETDPSAWCRNAGFVSNGAYRCTGWEPGVSITFEKNPCFYNASQVKVNKLVCTFFNDDDGVYQAYQAGELDFADSIPDDVIDSLSQADDSELHFADMLKVFNLLFNADSKLFDGKTPAQAACMRQAISLLIDRKQICESHPIAKMPADSFIPPDMADGNGGVFRTGADAGYYDAYAVNNDPEGTVAKVRELLKAAGYTFGDDGRLSADTPIEIEYLTTKGDDSSSIVNTIQQDFEAVGIRLTVTALEKEDFFKERKNGDFDMCYNLWIADFNDPINMLEMWGTSSDDNNCRFGRFDG